MSDSSKRKSSKDEKQFHLDLKWIMVLSAAAVALILLILAIIYLPRIMYTRNPRLVFKNLEIDTPSSYLHFVDLTTPLQTPFTSSSTVLAEMLSLTFWCV